MLNLTDCPVSFNEDNPGLSSGWTREDTNSETREDGLHSHLFDLYQFMHWILIILNGLYNRTEWTFVGTEFSARGSMSHCGASQHWLHVVLTTIDPWSRARFSCEWTFSTKEQMLIFCDRFGNFDFVFVSFMLWAKLVQIQGRSCGNSISICNLVHRVSQCT